MHVQGVQSVDVGSVLQNFQHIVLLHEPLSIFSQHFSCKETPPIADSPLRVLEGLLSPHVAFPEVQARK